MLPSSLHPLGRRAATVALVAASVACADVSGVARGPRLELRPDTVRTARGTTVAFAAVVVDAPGAAAERLVLTVLDTGVAAVQPAPGDDPRAYLLTARRPGRTQLVAMAAVGGRAVADTAEVEVGDW